MGQIKNKKKKGKTKTKTKNVKIQKGMGRYNDRYTFLAFSNEKPVVWKPSGKEGINSVRKPPYTNAKAKIWRQLLETAPKGYYWDWIKSKF